MLGLTGAVGVPLYTENVDTRGWPPGAV